MNYPSFSPSFSLIVLAACAAAACSSEESASPGGPSSGTTTTGTAVTSDTTVTTSTTATGATTTTGGTTTTSVTSVTNATSITTTTTGAGGAATVTTGTITSGGGNGGSVGTTGDTTGAGGTGGTGTTLMGGASAAFVCPTGETYGDPLAGMGAVQEIPAPSPSYFAFIEGPVWVGSLGTLFFSDNASSPDERIWKLVPPSTTPEIFMEPSGSNGLAIDNLDQLVLADQKNKQIVRVDSGTSQAIGTIAGPGSYKPNDVIVRSDDNVYFTDPDTGFYRISPAGEVTGPMTDVSRPNGIVLSPDENTLYVGDVGNKQIHAFQVDAEGSVSGGTLFTTATNDTVDGMAVDCAGNLYAGTSNGVEVYSPDAQKLGTVPTGEASNATFGGSDRKTLYVTSRALLKYVTLAVPGLPD